MSDADVEGRGYGKRRRSAWSQERKLVFQTRRLLQIGRLPTPKGRYVQRRASAKSHKQTIADADRKATLLGASGTTSIHRQPRSTVGHHRTGTRLGPRLTDEMVHDRGLSPAVDNLR